MAPISTTGSEAADFRKEQKNADRNWNMRVGPVEFRITPGVRQEYNDNIGLSEESAEHDFITNPHVDLEIFWPFSRLNNLDIRLGLSYLKYWEHSELDSTTLLIDPNSLLDFDLYMGDVRLNIHDRFAIQQDPIDVPQLSNLSIFHRWTNTAGVLADWDLNTMVLSAGFDHENFGSFQEQFSSLDHSTDTFRGKVGVRASSILMVGVQGAYFFTEYDQPIQNDSEGYFSGLFADALVSEYLRASASVGFQNLTFDQGGTIRDSSDFESITYSLEAHHQLNRWIEHSTKFHRFTTLGIGSNYTDIHELSYRAGLSLIQNLDSSIRFFYQWFEDSPSLISEKGTRYGLIPELIYRFSERTRASLGYQRTEKDSDLIRRDYEQNRIFADFTYQF